MRKRELLIGWFGSPLVGQALAQPSALDFIAGTVVRINAEQGTVTLRHDPIVHLHLPAAATVFHYIDPALITRLKEGDAIRFRADRFEGTLRLVAVLPLGAGGRP